MSERTLNPNMALGARLGANGDYRRHLSLLRYPSPPTNVRHLNVRLFREKVRLEGYKCTIAPNVSHSMKSSRTFKPAARRLAQLVRPMHH